MVAGCGLVRPPSSSTPAAARPAPPPPAIHYRLASTPGTEPDEEWTSIVADRDGKTFVIVAPQANPCPPDLVERDLDGDGLMDAIIEQGICGNFAPPTYTFVAGTRDDHFQQFELESGTARHELWRGRPSLVIESDNEGWNLERPQKVTRRFIFERGRAVVVEEIHAVEIAARADLRAEQFDGAQPDEERSLAFDLDDDGRVDKLVGTLWERWGRISWRVELADGRVSDGGRLVCKRLGVLAEKTRGFHDLVCDFDGRIRWNGAAYTAVAGEHRP